MPSGKSDKREQEVQTGVVSEGKIQICADARAMGSLGGQKFHGAAILCRTPDSTIEPPGRSTLYLVGRGRPICGSQGGDAEGENDRE